MLDVVVQGMGVGVALAAPIGPINIVIVRRGLQNGFMAGWLVGLGAVTADTLYCAIIIGGVAPWADNTTVRVPLFLAGAVVLLYLGIGAIRSARSAGTTTAPPPSGRRSYATGFMMAAANPMGIVYWFSIGAALVASAVGRAGQSAAPALLGGVFGGIVLWVTFLSLLALGGRRYVSESLLRNMTAVSGIVLLGFGIWFAYQAIALIFG